MRQKRWSDAEELLREAIATYEMSGIVVPQEETSQAGNEVEEEERNGDSQNIGGQEDGGR